MKKLYPFLLFLLIAFAATSQEINTSENLFTPSQLQMDVQDANADPSIYAYSTTTFCLEDSVLLGVQNLPSGYSYFNWYFNGSPISGATKTPYGALQAGSYTLVIFFSNGSTFITNAVNLAFAPQSTNAPTITALGPTTFCNGQSVNLSASSSSGLRWQKDGIDILNAFNQTYTASVGGTYRVKYVPSISLGCPGYSNEIIVSVTNISGPVITESSHSVPVCNGSSFTISASVPNVQWQKDGVNIPGATNQVLIVTDNGVYRAVQTGVTGSCNNISNEIAVTSFLPTQPTAVITASGPTTFCNGGSVVLTSSLPSVSGAVLQWKLNGTDITNANAQTFTATQSGSYTVYVTGNTRYCNNTGAGSNAIAVTVGSATNAPVITSNGTTTFCGGGSVIFTSNITGVQWQKDGVDISGATAQSYTATQAGVYRAVFKNTTGCDGISNTFTITILPTAATPVISAAGAVTVCNGGTVALSSSIAGVQWQKDGVDIPGAVSQAYTATVTGIYRAYVPGTSACGNNYSNTITVTVNGVITTPAITAATATTFCTGGNVVLTSSAPVVQWKRNGTDIAGAVNQTYTATQSGTYTVVASNGTCSATSNSIIVVVIDPSVAPVISATGPTFICSGGSVALTCNTAGVQWQKDSVNIAGATFQSYLAAASGTYRAFIPGAAGCGITYSNAITVVVAPTPTIPIISAGGPLSFCSGGNVVLTSSVVPVQWKLNGVDLPGQVNQTLTATQGGVYTATNIVTGCTSISAGITVTVVNAASTPVISAAGSLNICAGSTVSLISNIAGVQWQKDTVNVTGAISQSYNATSSGNYRAFVPNTTACGVTYSNVLTVTVSTAPAAPVISAGGPVSFCAGNTVTLTSSISAVQWVKDNVDIGGAVNQTLVAGQSGVYKAYTANGSCFAYSNAITVTAASVTAPVISAAGTTSVCSGGSVALTSNITGVQWQYNGAIISGAVNQTYNATQAGIYTAVAGSTSCQVTSNAITVTVSTPPTAPVISAGGPVSFCAGNTVTLTSSISSVQWVKDNVDVGGAINQTFVAAQSGVYKAYTANGNCFSYSNAITVTSTSVTAPVVSAAGSTSVCSGGSVALTSNITGVQWQYNGANISGATNQTYNATQGGVYTAVAGSSTSCQVTSNAVSVTVTIAPAAPVITAGGPVNFCSGGNVVLTSSVAPVQWIKDNADIGGATNQTFTATQAGAYKASVSNGGCTSYSNTITVAVTTVAAPTITPASSLTICAGFGVVLNSNITSVQWQFNGTNISGAVSQSYNATQAGNYTAVTVNNACSANSNTLTVIVNTPPATPVIAASGATTFCDGGSVSLASNTAGVQWLKDGANISGAINQTFTADKTGKYKVSVSAGGCTSYSNEITVTVNSPTAIPVITANNALNVCEGTVVTFTSNVGGVTWQKDNNTVAVNVQSLAATQSGVYKAILFSGQCPASSNSLTLNVNPAPAIPVIAATGATTFCDGGNVTLTSSAGAVQWLKDGANITGATGATYTATIGGKYKALATNGFCTSYSNEITVVVNASNNIPTITASGNLSICDGTNVKLSSNIAGVTWQKDFVTVAPNVQTYTATQAGSYRAVNFATACPGYSNALVVTVLPSLAAPAISATGPLTFCDGNSVTLASTISNITWMKDGLVVGTGQTFTATKAGVYKAFASNGNCTVYSNELTVAVNTPPVIPVVTASGSTTFCDGSNIVLVSNVSGVSWQKDLVTIAINSPTLPVSQAGSYRAVISGVCPGYSLPVVVNILPTPAAPVVTALGPVNFCNGDSVVLSSSIPNVQWLLNGLSVVNNITGQTYTAKQSGTYRAVVFSTNGCNGYSNPVPVTVSSAVITPVIVNAASSASTFCQNSRVNLVADLQTVQWQKDGVNIAGANNQVYTVTSTGAYRAVFIGGTCPGYSNTIPLTMIPQPLDPIIFRATPNLCDTGNVLLSSTMNIGAMRWQKDTIDIPNANFATYYASQTGNYRFIISLPNQCPSYSNILPVNVNTALKPVILWDGNQFRSFTQYSTYQWYLNGVAIAGAIFNTYKPLTPGNYKVITTTTPSCVLSSDNFQLLVTAVTTPASIDGNIVKQYPNPASNEAWIEMSQVPAKAVTVRLLSITGSVLQTIKTRQQKIKLNTSAYAAGLYFIELSGSAEKTVFKLVLTK